MSKYTVAALINAISAIMFFGTAYLFKSMGGPYVPLAWISLFTAMLWLGQCIVNLRRRGGGKK